MYSEHFSLMNITRMEERGTDLLEDQVFNNTGLVNLTHDNQTGKDNDVTWNLEVVSSKFFLHFWMGSIFIFILWPPALFRTNQKWSTKKASSSRCCYSVTRGIEETPELKYIYFVIVFMLFSSFCALISGICLMHHTNFHNVRNLGSTIICWNVLSMVAALARFIFTLHFHQPKFFDHDIELIYTDVFQPMHLNRNSFALMLKSTKCLSLVLPGQKYIVETMSRVDTLSLVISGRLLVSQNSKTLHTVSRHQFVDSPEWFGVTSDDHFQITATALEETRILVWHRDKLKLILSMADPFLKTVLDHVVARDVVMKLVQTQEGKTPRPVLPLSVPSAGLGDWELGSRVKHLLNGESALDTVATFRFPHNHHVSDDEDCYSWTLSRISEKDDEEDSTSVSYEPKTTQV